MASSYLSAVSRGSKHNKFSLLEGLMGQEVDMDGQVPQSQPLNERQVRNAAGGFTFKVDDMTRLRRFLIFGSEGGTFYIDEQKLTLESARAVKALLDAGKGLEVVKEVVTVSTEGRAPKQAPGVFALALACRLGDEATKRAAFEALPKVCRTSSTLFDFVAYSKAINQEVAEAAGRKANNASWGRAMRHAVANWYLEKTPMKLAFQVTKYGQRGGWSNRDLLRLAHPKPEFVRVAAQRQATAAATGQLEKTHLGGDDEDDDWSVVAGEGADDKGQRNAPDAGDETARLDRRIEELQIVFKFMVDEEAAPAGEGAGRVAAYLAAAHRLKKAQLQSEGDDAAQPSDMQEDPTAADAPAAAPESEARGSPAAAPADAARVGAGGAAAAAPEAAAAASKPAAEPPAAKKRKVAKAKAPVEPITEGEACQLIRAHRFNREHVGDGRLLRCIPVWSALLANGMPFTALTRNLGRLTSLGLFDEERCASAGEHLTSVTSRFREEASMKAARAHPIVLLNALRIYASGHGDLGKLSWEPHSEIKAALDDGFYLAFRNVALTGKRFLLGVDVSGSMGWCKCAGMSALTARDAAAAVAMCLLRTEGVERVTTMAFSTKFQRLDLRPEDSLEQALAATSGLDFGGTDCALPMTHALHKGLKVDVFVVLTDSETWAGGIHPTEALEQYRQKTGISARLLVCAFAGSASTIADPEDAGMLDMPGLDSGTPQVMRQFVLGEL